MAILGRTTTLFKIEMRRTKMAKIKATTLMDKLYKMKLDIEADEAKLKKKKDKYSEGRETLLQGFTKEQISTLKGKLAKATVVTSKVPTITDKDKFLKYVMRNKATDLLKNGVSTAAYRERLNAGKKVPGVETFTVVSLRLGKA